MWRWVRGVLDPVEVVIRLLRPEFWVVSVIPGWIGWVLATGEIAPDQDALLALLGADGPRFSPGEWWDTHWRVVLAIVTLGPLLGGSIMITNDYFDRSIDVFNPRKTRSPLVAGTATPQRARFLMVLLVAASIVCAFIVHTGFGFCILIGQFLSFAYSAPPVRLKARPLGDVGVNALGYGVVAFVAGGVFGGGWVERFPAGPLLILVLAIIATYAPTVMVDHDADRAAGLRTTAVSLGLRRTWALSFASMLAANALMVAFAFAGIYVPARFLAFQLPFFLLEYFAFIFWIGSKDPREMLGGAIVNAVAVFANLGAFLLVYTHVVGL